MSDIITADADVPARHVSAETTAGPGTKSSDAAALPGESDCTKATSAATSSGRNVPLKDGIGVPGRPSRIVVRT